MKRSPPTHKRRRPDGGFSLVELTVSSALLMLALTGTSILFVESNRSSAAATLRYRQQSLVDTDLARVRRLNDRYTCNSGTCTSLGTVELGKNDFFPPPTSTAATGNSAAGNSFEALCNSTTLISQLVADIGSAPSNLTTSGIAYTVDPNNQGEQSISEFGTNVTRNLHRYTITYTYTNTDSGTVELLRRVSLVPTTAAWCP